jgi:uncharacterized protein YjbI with pentapeptide repeats
MKQKKSILVLIFILIFSFLFLSGELFAYEENALRLARMDSSTSKYLSQMDLSKANLKGENLKSADLWKANLTGANLTGANLILAKLKEANLTGANLSGADLRGARLDWAKLTGANLTGANLSWASLYETNLTGANLTGANLTEATLNEANLTEANLTGANLSKATLFRSNFFKSDLSKANLTEARLDEANLTGAILTGAILTGANLTGIKIDKKTRFTNKYFVSWVEKKKVEQDKIRKEQDKVRKEKLLALQKKKEKERLELPEKDLGSFYQSYVTLKKCHEVRKGYAAVHVNSVEMENIKSWAKSIENGIFDKFPEVIPKKDEIWDKFTKTLTFSYNSIFPDGKLLSYAFDITLGVFNGGVPEMTSDLSQWHEVCNSVKKNYNKLITKYGRGSTTEKDF